eukprot:m.92567 g.92567  ORF g.92567 m.92567 type:complete len:857 (-) comp12362_c0_seq1:90-2660(-)
MSEETFDELEGDINAFLKEHGDDPAFEPFREKYSKLHDALLKSHENEQHLEDKIRELNAELVSSSAKVQSALEGNRDDEMSVSQLQKEVDEAWKLVDQGRESEAKLKEQLEDLKDEVTQLNEEMEEQTAQAHQRSEDVAHLTTKKKELEIERDNLMEETGKMHEEVKELQTNQVQLEEEKNVLTEKIEKLTGSLQEKQAEAERENRRRTHLERELSTKRGELDSKQAEVDEAGDELRETHEVAEKLREKLREKDSEIDSCKKEIEKAEQKNSKLENQVEDSLKANENAFNELMSVKQEVKAKEEQIGALKTDVQRAQKSNEVLQKKLKTSEEKRQDVIKSRDSLKTEISALERELEAAQKQNEVDSKRLEELARARDSLTKKMLVSGKETEVQEALVKMHENTAKSLEQEVDSFKEENAKQRKIIFQLEKERDKYINDAAAIQNKALGAMEEVKVAENQVVDLKKNLHDSETKLKQLQALYEQVRNDRNLYSKNLIEAQDEIQEMKRKLKIMNHQIDQLKEEITTKEGMLQKEKTTFEALELQKTKLKSDFDRLKILNQTHETKIAEKVNEKQALEKLIKEAEEQCRLLQLQNERVMKLRDQFAIQVTRRNTELELLYQKLQIQATALHKGEVQFREMDEDVRILKLEVKRLRREKNLLAKNITNVDALRRELFTVQRELLKEKTRCRALEEEVQTPMNVHRWRQLEGSDPNTFEMIQKVQTLQKRLIQKTSEVVEKELKIQEKERQYMELKTILSRQPGPEVSEQLQAVQKAVKEKNKQLKSMASEVNMYRAQVEQHKYELESVSKELHDMKKKYFQQKKREMLAKDKARNLTHTMPAVTSTAPKVSGGGFAFKA